VNILSAKREFGADVELKSLYRTYAAISFLGGFVWWIVILSVVLAFIGEFLALLVVGLGVILPIFIVFGFALYWIPKFYSSITYVLESDELVVSKGVWWKTKSVIPYNRITNVNTYQGPISRRYGLGKLAIQTAGFSGGNSSGGRLAEANFIGLKNFEAIKEDIMSYVKGTKPVAVEAAAEPLRDANKEVLEELRRIRKAVEK
jgi:membrane protein YdbS with pleckstrin-like domain